MMSMSECQVLVQDVALELVRLDRRLRKITHAAPNIESLFGESLEAVLQMRVRRLRRRLQESILLFLELAQVAGDERLRRDACEEEIS